MLAICIVLLIWFMMLPGPPHHALPVDLAAASHAVALPDARKEDAIVVAVTRDGTAYFRNYRTSRDNLPGAIRQAVREGAERKVYVKADARARYSDVEAVVEAIRQAGILNIVFVTESR